MTQNCPEHLVAGIDIGGSHITIGLIDLNKKECVENILVRYYVDSHGTAEEILTKWADAIKELWAQSGTTIQKIGFAMPGPFDYPNGICLIKGFNKYEALYGMNIREELAKRLNIEPGNILFRNDAEAFLEGEVFCGSAKGYANAIGITLGTGLGSSICKGGKTIDAELSVMDYNGEYIEESVSTRGLVRNYFRLTGKQLKDAKAVVALYPHDNNAVRSFEIFAKDLSWFLVRFIQKQSPEILVIGGNIANAWDKFMPQVMTYLSKELDIMPVIVKSSLMESAALIGGACNHKPQLV